MNRQLLLFFILSLFFCHIAHGEPWGKDSDLCVQCKKTISPKKCETPILGRIGETLIRFHQTTISPADGPRSHFVPCSSQYTLNAMRKYGFSQGFLLGCDRLMRENSDPWIYRKIFDKEGNAIKWNPVP